MTGSRGRALRAGRVLVVAVLALGTGCAVLRDTSTFVRDALLPGVTGPRPITPAEAARLDEVPMQGAGGAPYSNAERVLLRRFYCPGCGALLDTESALAGDPFLTDIVRV